jgi:nucleoside-diphosphate-sugar epimerase
VILVTGGNGYVGQSLCQQLADSGRDVASVSRKVYETSEYPSLVADVSDKYSLEGIFKKYPVDTVVHLASMLNTASRQNPDRAVRINVNGSLNLMELCRDFQAKRFIFGSSFNAIGSLPGIFSPVDENAPSQPSEFYGETKRFVEKLGISMSEICGFDFISARMAIIVGPGEPSPTSAWRTDMFNLLNSGGKIRITFSPDEIIPLSHFEEVAETIKVLVESEQVNQKIYHLPNESWLVSDLAATLESLSAHMHVTFGEGKLDGIPANVSSYRFEKEFEYKLVPMYQKLKSYMEETSSVS